MWKSKWNKNATLIAIFFKFILLFPFAPWITSFRILWREEKKNNKKMKKKKLERNENGMCDMFVKRLNNWSVKDREDWNVVKMFIYLIGFKVICVERLLKFILSTHQPNRTNSFVFNWQSFIFELKLSEQLAHWLHCINQPLVTY